MFKKIAIEYFEADGRGGVPEMARLLGVTPEAIYDWGEKIPQRRAYELEHITDGALRAEWPNKPPAPAQLPGPAGA